MYVYIHYKTHILRVFGVILLFFIRLAVVTAAGRKTGPGSRGRDASAPEAAGRLCGPLCLRSTVGLARFYRLSPNLRLTLAPDAVSKDLPYCMLVDAVAASNRYATLDLQEPNGDGDGDEWL